MTVYMIHGAGQFFPDMIRFIPQFGMPIIPVTICGSFHAESILINLEKFFSGTRYKDSKKISLHGGDTV